MGTQALAQQPDMMTERATRAIPDHPLEFPSGNAYLDQGTTCELKSAAHSDLWRHYIDEACFLDPEQRRRYVESYQRELDNAKSNYVQALDDARIKELLAEEEDDSSLMFELMLDVIGLFTANTISSAYRALRLAGKLGNVGEGADKICESLVKQAVATGKKALPKPTIHDDAAAQTKTAVIAYIDLLRNEASIVYGFLGEDSLAYANDANLMVLHEAFDKRTHTIAAYQQVIDESLKRFKASPVSQIGAHKMPPQPDQLTKVDELISTEDIKVFWVRAGLDRRLATYKRHHLDEDLNIDFTKTEQEKHEAFESSSADIPWEFAGYVADDLVDVALRVHAEKWGELPQTIDAGWSETLHWKDVQ